MNLLRYLFQNARKMMVFTGLVALLGGACNAGLIALVNQALNSAGQLAGVFILGFGALALGKLSANFISAVVLVRFSQTAIARLRCDLVKKVLAVPLRHLEEIGTARVMVVLTEDIMNITQALLAIPGFTVNIAILCCGAIYLAWLSWQVMLLLGIFILFGAIGYRLLIIAGFHRLNSAREEEDRLFSHFHALMNGIKELKLHRQRRQAFFTQNVTATTAAYQQHNVAAEIRFAVAQAWNHLLVLVVIGMILFALPAWQHISPQALTGYVVTTLYLMGPLAGVMGCLSVFARANVSLAKAEKLGMTLCNHSTEECPLKQSDPEPAFECLEMVGVTHSYHHEKDDSCFMLGPIHLILHPGELVFLVGGNGSGKTTLAKILAGLYVSESGEIRLDGKPVGDHNRDDYRQLFAAVFSDFHLFENLLGLHTANLDGQAREYLEQFHLDHKVRVSQGTFSTTALSQGQRKRLALLTAYLEDRPLYLFDEWASDQDPQFKEVFYCHLLPELKRRGKTVIVITHDEKYFHHADRLLKLDYGKLIYDKRCEPHVHEAVLQV